MWAIPIEHYGSFVAMIPSLLGISVVELCDGARVQGFLCEAAATVGTKDFSHHGGWRAFLEASA